MILRQKLFWVQRNLEFKEIWVQKVWIKTKLSFKKIAQRFVIKTNFVSRKIWVQKGFSFKKIDFGVKKYCKAEYVQRRVGFINVQDVLG